MLYILYINYMFPNFDERKHLEHTDIFFDSPFTFILTVLRFGFHVLFALLLTWERAILILFPFDTALPQISEEGFSAESITAGEGNLSYVTDEGVVTEGTIYDVITSLRGSSFAGKMEIIKGELLINSQDMEEIRVAQSMGIQPVDMFPYTSHVEVCALLELKNCQ